MLLQIFTVYDSKAEAYLQPFYMGTRGEAIRAFSDSVNDPNTAFHKHPSDYTLFALGTWDNLKCNFFLQPTPDALGLALEFLHKANGRLPGPETE